MPREQIPDPVERALEQIRRLQSFVDINAYSLEQFAAVLDKPSYRERIEQLEGRSDLSEEIKRNTKESAERRTSFAAQERAEGFPYLYGFATIQLWTIIESVVDAEVIERIRKQPRVPTDAIAKLKAPVWEFLHSSKDEQAEQLLELLKEKLLSRSSPGLARTEALLEAVNLGGPIDPKVRAAMLECQQVRNVIVHRDGVADSRLCELCPWLNLKSGDRVRVSADEYRLYSSGALWYAGELARRIGVERDGHEDAATRFTQTVSLRIHLEQWKLREGAPAKDPRF